MPEGPELFLSSLYINRTCGGLIFSGKVVKNPIHKCQDVSWNESSYTISAESKGKELMLHLRSCTDVASKSNKIKECSILFTFGMSGKFEFTAADNMLKHSHLMFFTKSEPKMGLAFVDYRRFGKWVEGGKWSDDRGPCVIQDHDGFINNVAANLNCSVFNKPICEVLQNQKFFNGIGNYLRAEILFRCGVPPFEKARSVLKIKEPKQESNTDDAEIDKSFIDKKGMRKEARQPINGSNDQQIPGNEDNSKIIKEEVPDSDAHCGIDLFVPKAQELLKLCGSVPLEVIDIGSTKYNLSDLYKDDSEGKSFKDWLQCYYQEGMKNMADHNNRTIWFSGPAGPLIPKVQKVRGRKKTNTSRHSKEETDTCVKQQESTKKDKGQSIPAKVTRTKLKEYKQETSKAKDTPKNKEQTENVLLPEKSRKRKKDTPCDSATGKKTKKSKTNEKNNVAKRLTRSTIKFEQ